MRTQRGRAAGCDRNWCVRPGRATTQAACDRLAAIAGSPLALTSSIVVGVRRRYPRSECAVPTGYQLHPIGVGFTAAVAESWASLVE